MEEIAQYFIKNKKTLASAESCTGGNIGHKITEISGASEYYLGGVISYAIEVKNKILGVSLEDIKKYGVVSEIVAKEMAIGVMNTLGSDFAVSTTGIAGPGGGTEKTPVGTICIATCSKEKNGNINCIAKTFHFGTNRKENIQSATTAALQMLKKLLK